MRAAIFFLSEWPALELYNNDHHSSLTWSRLLFFMFKSNPQVLETQTIVFSKYFYEVLWSTMKYYYMKVIVRIIKYVMCLAHYLALTGYSASFNPFLSHQSNNKKIKNIFVCLLPVFSFSVPKAWCSWVRILAVVK